MRFALQISALFLLLFIFGCATTNQSQEQKSQALIREGFTEEELAVWQQRMCPPSTKVIYGSPEEIMKRLANTLKENRIEDAMQFIMCDEETQAYRREFFEALGEAGVSAYGQKLENLKLTEQTEKQATFSGAYRFKNIGEEREAKAYLVRTPFGWKLSRVE